MATETTEVGEINLMVTNNTSITKDSKKKKENIKYSQPDIEASKPKYSSGGRLLYFSHEWEKVSYDQFIQSIISEGYQIEFAQPPAKFSRVITTHLSREEGKKLCMIQEINSLLEKRAIEIVPNPQISAGFYSTVFLVDEKTGGYRMVSNVKSLNKFIRTHHFKMKTLRSVEYSLD